MAEYTVVLKDADGCDIATDLVVGLGEAKARARYFLSDYYTRRIGTTHAVLGTQKVEIVGQDQDRTVVWDAFLPAVTTKGGTV